MSIRKRGKRRQVVFRVPGEDHPRTESFASEDEAMIRDMQIKLAKKKGTFEAPPIAINGEAKQIKNLTVKVFLEEYIEQYGLKRWGNSYYTQCESLIRCYINPFIGTYRLATLTTRDIDSYYSRLLESPAVVIKGHHDTGVEVSAFTLNRVHKLLKSAFSKAAAWHYMETNPVLGATLPEARCREREVWSDAEALNALSLCNDPTLHLCLMLALGCSMRLGEILGLQWSNVFMGKSLAAAGEAYLKVDKELNRCSNKSIAELERVSRSTIVLKFPTVIPKNCTTTLVLKAPKTESSIRSIYLPLAVVEELRKIRAQQQEYKRLLDEEYRDYDLVVAQINGRPYEARIIDKMFFRFIEAYELRPVVFHSLRHSSTSLKLKLSRGNIKAVQGDTGHAEARMVTDTYAHSFDEDRKLIAQEMDTGFFSKVGSAQQQTEPASDAETLETLRLFVQQHPECLSELLNAAEKE